MKHFAFIAIFALAACDGTPPSPEALRSVGQSLSQADAAARQPIPVPQTTTCVDIGGIITCNTY